MAQVVGGSLAAATAAALSSRLGVAGTIAGAAVISMVTAVASALYTQSLRRTHTRVRAVTQVARSRISAGDVAPEAETVRPRARIQLRPRRLIAGVAVIFALAIAGITGFELLTGQPLSGGGGGTTLGEIADAGSDAGSGGNEVPAGVAPTPSSVPTGVPSSTPPPTDPTTTSPTPTDPTPTSPDPTTTPPGPTPPGGGNPPG